MLLNLNEKFLKKNGFEDVWKCKKEIENAQALQLLSHRLEKIDSIAELSLRWKEIVRGVLAGNIFDAGT